MNTTEGPRSTPFERLMQIQSSDPVTTLRGRNMVILGLIFLALCLLLSIIVVLFAHKPLVWLPMFVAFAGLDLGAITLARKGKPNQAGAATAIAISAIIPLGAALTGSMGSGAWFLMLGLFAAAFTTHPRVLWGLLAFDLLSIAMAQTFIKLDRDGDGLLVAPFAGFLLIATTATLYAFTTRMWRNLSELAAARVLAEQANEAKTQFLTNMSHELRTPLNAIIGYSELILEDTPDEHESHHDLTRIREASDHLLHMINDLLDVAKIEHGEMTLLMHPTPLEPLLQDCIKLARPLVEAQSNTLRFEQIDLLPTSINVDATRLRQILLNLLSNAAKFTDQGVITLRASCDTDWLTLQVIDSGAGIAPEDQERIFETFAQTEAGKRHKSASTGLGLPLSRKLAELHGGTLKVESQLGQGSTFVLMLPL